MSLKDLPIKDLPLVDLICELERTAHDAPSGGIDSRSADLLDEAIRRLRLMQWGSQ
jgi:hypothetical protein